MKNQIHGAPGQSSYFQGDFATYGKHQWNVKFYDLSDEELEALQDYYLQDPYYLVDTFQVDPVKVFLAGRSNGWLVVDQELNQEQIDLISETVLRVKRNRKEYAMELLNFNKA